MRIHLTRAATFGPICDFLEAGGDDVARRLECSGIAPELLRSPEALLPLRSCSGFAADAALRVGFPDLGIAAGSRTAIGEFGLFGMVLRQSLTLKDLLEKLVRWVPLLDSGARVWIDEENETDSVRLWIEHETDTGKDLVNEYALMLLVDAVRIAAGPEWRPAAVWMNRSGNGALSRFEGLSEASVHRHPVAAGMRIPRRLLSLPVRRESQLRGRERDTEHSLQQTAPPDDLIGSVSQAIRAGLGSRLPVFEEVAALAGINGRTLQRGLKSQGTSYRELLDRVRFETASRCLRDEAMPVSEIAWLLGYTELSNFTHAFRRWTGLSPSEFRVGRARGT